MTLVDDRRSGDKTFTDADFARIARRAHADFGLHLPVTKKDLVYSRLTKRLRELGLRDFQSYCGLLEGPDGSEERSHMLSALTTNVTHFFREPHHFKLLREQVLPRVEKALADTQHAYTTGRYGYFELQLVQGEVLTTRMALVVAAIDAHKRLIEIERLTGTVVTSSVKHPRGFK